jgi:hypothetical protein
MTTSKKPNGASIIAVITSSTSLTSAPHPNLGKTLQYYCHNDGFNLGLRIAWSVRAGGPAYSVSRGRRAHLARRRGASSETTSLWLFLCELLGILRL